MKLKKEHKEVLLEWIAEGLLSNQINERAALFHASFSVSKSQISYYRKKYKDKIKALSTEWENEALFRGLARKEIRIMKLVQLVELLEKDLLEKELIWLEDRKGVGQGHAAEIYDFYRFNRAEIETYRGLLDDIAKEVGDRIVKIAPTDPTGKEEYGADARNAILSRILPGIAFEDEEGEAGEVND